MQINSISGQNFGKLYIKSDNTKNRLYAEILQSNYQPDVYKEVIADLIEIQKSSNNHVILEADGSIVADGEYLGTKSTVMGRNLFEKFATALRVARPIKHQNFLNKFNQTFGSINIDKKVKDGLKFDVLCSIASTSALKEAICDMIENTNNHKISVNISKDAKVTSRNQSKGTSNAFYSETLDKSFFYALKKSRSDEFNSLLKSIENGY